MDTCSGKPVQKVAGVAVSCIELFNECLAKDPDAFATLEGEERRFWAVLNTLKVFANPKVNLDAQLSFGKHPQIREMVLLLLKVLKDNLSLALNSNVSSNRPDINRTVLEIPFFGIDGSLKRLEKVAVAMMQATQASLTRRVIAYTQRESNKDDCERITRTFSLTILTRYRGVGPPNIPMFGIPPELIPSPDEILRPQPLGLFFALLKTSIVRHFRICYERRDSVMPDKSTPAQNPAEEEGPELGVDVIDQEEHRQGRPSNQQKGPQNSQARDGTQSETKTNPLSIQTNVFKEKIGEASSYGPRGRRPVSEAGVATYPQPPKISDGQTHATCPICKRVLPVSMFEGLNWTSHVNLDIKPYACISEDCMSNLQFFEDSSSWINHIHKTHTTQWIRYLHNAFSWTCPVCHAVSPMEFDTKGDMEQSLIGHFEQEHSDVIEKSNRQSMASVSGVPRHRPMDTCPICEDFHPVKTALDPGALPDGESNDTTGKVSSRTQESSKPMGSTKRARFNIPPGSDSEGIMMAANSDVGSSIRPPTTHVSKRTPLTGVEKCIGDHLKALAFYFSDRLIEDENENDIDDGYEFSAASKRSANSRLIALESLASVGSNADPPQFPLGEYDGPPITDKEKEEVKNCINRNLQGFLEDSYDWGDSRDSRQLQHANISRDEIDDSFPDNHRQSNERFWKGIEPKIALIYVACILVVLELCEIATRKNYGKLDAPIVEQPQLEKNLTEFSNALASFPVLHPCGKILEVVEECALESQLMSAKILSHLQKTTNEEMIPLSVLNVARRRLELCIVLADINSHIEDLWRLYLEATKIRQLDSDQWVLIETIVHAITSRNPKFFDLVRTNVRESLRKIIDPEMPAYRLKPSNILNKGNATVRNTTKIDLIVGIDFGMTCSGVAYARPKMKSPKLIQEWPGTTRPGELNNKVPTSLLYGRDNSLKSWGFACQTNPKKKEWFKRYLDESVFNEVLARSQQHGEEAPYETIEEVRQCYEDYMTCLYKHLSEKIQKDESWEKKRVDFIFSLPATFTAPQITNSLRPLLANAGFGTGGKYHSVTFGLTEPQASAVYTVVDQTTEFEANDILLVCDAGGGTTDIAILQKEGDDDDGAELKELLPVVGYNFGSTNIDESFCCLVEDRLAGAEGLEVKDNAAWTMMHSDEFQSWKRSFGTLDEKQFKDFPVKVPGLKLTTSNEKAGITMGAMLFSHDDFKQLFDIEVDKMIKYIRNQMNIMRLKYSGRRIDYLALSGGLGSSAYVQKRLKEAFTGTNSHSAAPKLKVIAAENDEPQLAVVKGLVLDQMQRGKTGKGVLQERMARASYGVVCDVLYDPKTDYGHPRYKDPIDGKWMLKGHIVWVIKKDHPISVDDAKTHEFTRVFPRNHSRKWKSTIVICHNDADDLPDNVNVINSKEWNPDVMKLAEVESDLSNVNIKKFTEHQGKRRFFSRDDPYYEARYDVKFVIGAAADARFELWFQGQQWTAKNAINIEWQEGANVPTPTEPSPKKFFSTGRTRRTYEWGTDDDD